MNNQEIEGKHFAEWIKLKGHLHYAGRVRTFKEGEIWWCSIGENVGVEINGKGSQFTRPVLILKKLSRLSFIGVPLTSQLHEGTWYEHFIFKDKEQVAVLAQIRNISVSRLINRMGTLPNSDFVKVKRSLMRLMFE